MDKESLVEYPCWVCGKVWTRGEAAKWYFFDDKLVCREHDGAGMWYKGAMLMTVLKYSANQKYI